MPINLNLSGPGKLVTIKDTSVSTSSESRVVTAVNSWIINDGPSDIDFTVTDTDGNTQTFTLKSAEIEMTPFQFKQIAWVTTSGSSAFRMNALQLPRAPGR